MHSSALTPQSSRCAVTAMAMAGAITVAEAITTGGVEAITTDGVEAITTDGAVITIDENIKPLVVILKQSASRCGSAQP
jgi:hypothetical protein